MKLEKLEIFSLTQQGQTLVPAYTRTTGNGCQTTGNWIVGILGEGMWRPFNPRTSDPGPGHWFMDMVVEESMELMAAALLVAAVIAYRRHHQQQRRQEDGDESPEA